MRIAPIFTPVKKPFSTFLFCFLLSLLLFQTPLHAAELLPTHNISVSSGDSTSTIEPSSVTTDAVYYILRENLVQPSGSDYLNWNGYWRVGYGTISTSSEILNNSEDVSPYLLSVPTNSDRVPNEAKVEWYTIRQTANEWRVEGRIVTEEDTTNVENAMFYLLGEGTTKPEIIPGTFHSSYFTQIGYGTIHTPTLDITTYENDNSHIVYAPDCSSYLSEGEYILWYAICNNKGVWEVAGEICSKDSDVPQTDTITYYLLNSGVQKPEDGTALVWSDYTRVGYGTMQHTDCPLTSDSDIASMLTSVPDCSKYLSEGDSIEWYAVRECNDSTSWRVDGIIIPAIPETPAPDFIRAEGTEIVDSKGNPFQIKGIGMGNNVWYTQWQLPTTDHDEESFAELEALGFNSVRFYLNASLFESDSAPYTYSETAFQWLDENVQWAKKHNIRLLLNMHIPQGGRVTSTNTAFWDNSEYQARFVALWTEIAKRYAGDDTILGYGLLNEPFVPELSTKDASLDLYYNLMEQTADAIRAVDNNHMLFVERPYGTVNFGKNTTNYVWGTTDSFRLISDTNTVYEFHFYDRTEFTHQGLSWLPYSDKWIYNMDNIALLSGARNLGKICKTQPTSLDTSSSEWQHIESEPITITNKNANYGYWLIYLHNMGENADTYIDNIVIKEYDQNGTYLRDLHTYTFDTATQCAGWDLGSGGGGAYSYSTQEGTSGTGCAKLSNVQASYRFYRNYDNVNVNFPVTPEHTYIICADVRLDNVSPDFSMELGIQTATCEKVYSFDKEYLRACLQPFLTFSAQNNVALYLGEFGVTRHVMNEEYHGDAWVIDTFELINEYGLGYSYHDYHEENFGLYINDSRQYRNERNETLYNIFTSNIH